jgi:LPXTG-motif cell wall-anchored protein
MNTVIIVIVGLIAVGLIAFLIYRNKKDRKELLPPEDAAVEQKIDSQKNKEEL